MFLIARFTIKLFIFVSLQSWTQWTVYGYYTEKLIITVRISRVLESLCLLFVDQVYLQPFLRSKLFHNYVRDLIATIQVSLDFLLLLAVLGIRIRSRIRISRINMLLGLPDPLVRGTDPAPIILSSSKTSKKNLCFVTSLWFFILEKLCKCSFKK